MPPRSESAIAAKVRLADALSAVERKVELRLQAHYIMMHRENDAPGGAAIAVRPPLTEPPRLSDALAERTEYKIFGRLLRALGVYR